MTQMTQMTSGEQIVYGMGLVKHALQRALADGRDLLWLSKNPDFVSQVFIEYALREDNEAALDIVNTPAGFKPRLVMDDAHIGLDDDDQDYLDFHREQTGSGIDAATWGR